MWEDEFGFAWKNNSGLLVPGKRHVSRHGRGGFGRRFVRKPIHKMIFFARPRTEISHEKRQQRILEPTISRTRLRRVSSAIFFLN